MLTRGKKAMDSSLRVAIVFWLSFACLWTGGSAQYLDVLKSKLQELEDREELLADRVLGHHLRKVKGSIEENFNSFWPPDLDALEQLALGSGSIGNLTEECVNGTIRLLLTTDPVTHLPLIFRLVDAMGKIGAGFLDGNIYATGAYDECMDIGPGDAQYCTGSLSLAHIRSPLPLAWNYGLCVPRGCTPEDVIYAVGAVTFGQAKLNASTVHCESARNPPLSAGAIVMIAVCCIFATLVMTATTLDFVVSRIQALTPNGNIQEDNSTDKLSEKAPLVISKSPTRKERGQLFELVTTFSLLKVIPQILSTKQPPSAITSINGLRVMSMFWVILCHTHFWVLLTGADNVLTLTSVLSRFAFQAIGNAFFSVDSFFFLSGLLVAYLSMREMKRKNGQFPFLAYYLHRYLRLTPTYAFVLFFTWSLVPYLGNGPEYSLATGEQSAAYRNCEKYWWTNLIYINNLYPWSMSDECIGWTWYLANDMQFYIFSPLILIPMYFLFPIGLAISAAVLAGCFIISGTLAGVYDLQANEFAQFAYHYASNNTSPYTSFQDLLYVKPWHRVAPYIIGVILGYVLYRLRLPAKRYKYYFLFSPLLVISALCLFWTLYGLYFTWHGHIPTMAENVIYIMFSRSVWALGLALLVLACHYGYGGPINVFLSMKFWIPLSRISYNAYLLHPLILTVIFASERKPIHYQDYNLAVYAIGIIVLSYGAAAIVSVFVEFPIGNLEQTLFKMVGLGRHESARTGGERHGERVLGTPLHSQPILQTHTPT